MHIIVVGANGFIASHFVPLALTAGHQLTLVANGNFQRQKFSDLDCELPNTTVLFGGLAALAEEVDLLASADAVCHFASSSIPSTSNADPLADIAENLLPSVALLEGMRNAQCKRIVFLSSGGAIYGHPLTQPIKEDHPTRPISSYGVTKLGIESYLGMYADQHGFQSTIIRPSNAYGPGQINANCFGAVTTFLENCLTDQEAQIWGDGSIVRDYIFVTDIVELILAALGEDKPGVYNCGSGVGTDINLLIANIESVVGKPLRKSNCPARPFDPEAIVLDITRAKQRFGWRPKISLEIGLQKTLAGMRRRQDPIDPSKNWQHNAK